jgi:hypothetical protein
MAFDWKSLVKNVAPTIGTALGGPLGGLAVKFVGDALGLSEATEEAIAKALPGATAEQLAAIKQADQAFATKMKELDIDLEKVHAGDRASARQMAVIDHWTPRILTTLNQIGVYAILAMLIFKGIPKDMAGSEAFLLIVGAILGSYTASNNFYFGSSASGRAKDEMLTKR